MPPRRQPARRRPTPANAATPPESGLRLHAEGDRLGALLKERDRLLSTIRTKKRSLGGAQDKARDGHTAMVEKLSPLVTRYEAVRAELRALFEQLLEPGRLSASAAKKVAGVRRTLERQGVLDAPDPPPVDDADWESPGRPGQSRPSPGARGASQNDFSRREVDSAEQRGQGKDQESLRTVFRRLVAASHPDRASHEAERQERTAVMKQATQAYEQGDLARLLELEQAWQRREALPPSGSAEARCRELETVIAELSAQAKQLQSELREAKRQLKSTLVDETVDEAFREAREEIEQLEVMRDFVLGFRDGKISLSRFVAGPTRFEVEDDIDLEALLSEVLREQSRPTKRSNRR